MEDTDVKKSEREALDEGKMKEFHDFMQKGKSPEFIAKKMGLDLKTVKQLMDHLDEASTSTGDVEQAKRDLEHAKLQKKIKNVKYDSVKGTVEESVELDESMDDTLKRLKKMGGSVYGDKLTSKSDKTPAKLASQSRGKKTVYFVVTDDGYTEYKDLGAVKKAWTIAGNNDDAKIALDLMSKQGDGDAIDMVLNKYKISIDKLDKIVKNNLGAKTAADFLGEAVALDEAFLRLPGEMINGELPMAIRDLESILRGLKAGNDFDAKGFNKQIARLNTIKKEAKKFNSEDEVPTRYQYRADPRYKNK
jgi:hypothetical protein